MIQPTTGNLLEADVDALVNTVNTVGVMGKGIALMFKEAFPENFARYAEACSRGEIEIGRMFATEGPGLSGPRWIVNFPTKKHWRNRTRLEWIEQGVQDLRRVIVEKGIRSIAIPPLGCGHGGLDWRDVRPVLEAGLRGLEGVEIRLYEPSRRYQNLAKRSGVEKLTPARALIAELVRRYWVLGIECSVLEIQKLAWFLERTIARKGLENPLDLRFVAHRYGPYADRLRHLLDALDGSYLHCERRLADARPTDTIWFDEAKRERVALYLRTAPDGASHLEALDATEELIDGFQSPHGLELLSTVDWLLAREGREPTTASIREGLRAWPGGAAAERKMRMFDDRQLHLAIERLVTVGGY